MQFIHTAVFRCKNKLKNTRRFMTFVIKHFIADDCAYRASALAFTTLLAIVPLMSVGFAILSSFPVFYDLSGPLQDFIFENFVPSTGKIIQDYLQLFAHQVTKLSLIGVVFLFITAILVMYTIERSMNKIWHVRTSRKGVSAFLLYWAILSLSPFLLGLSLAASSYFLSMPLIKGYHAPHIITNSVPMLLSSIGFTFLYVVVPNCRVKLRHGFYGAVVAAALFESAKHGFIYYLKQYNTYHLLYGAFATVPIFFVWVYWVWLITLFGAEISYALSVKHQRRENVAIDGLTHALLWLQTLWHGQLAGKSIAKESLINITDRPFSVSVDSMLLLLMDVNLVKRTSTEHYFLSRDLSHVTLSELLNLLPYKIPTQEQLQAMPAISNKWNSLLIDAHKTLAEKTNVSLETLFSDNDKP